MPGSTSIIDTRLSYLRYTTKVFIAGDPRNIILNRQVRIRKPGGGHDFPKVPIPEQTFRFINQDIQSGIAYSQSDDIARRWAYVMLGLYDADVDINDTWEEGEKQFRVESIVPNNQWESRAYVTAYAMEPDKG